MHASSPSAYPPTRSLGLLPFNIYYGWTSSLFDDDFYNAVKQSAAQTYCAALAESQAAIASTPVYPNYAIFVNTPLSNIYGSNVAQLQSLKASVDPNNIMGLAGSFKF